MKFNYVAQTREGENKIGIIDAINLDEAKKELLGKDLILISLKPIRKKRKGFSFSIMRVSHLDRLLFVRHLAMMVRAGLPLREGVVEIKDQTRARGFKKVLDDIVKRLDNGESLSNSLSKHPKAFDELFINLVEAGEASGTLEKNLNYLAVQLEKRYDLRVKVKGAMFYPIIIIVSTLGLVGVLSVFVLPKLLPLFKSFNIELPLPTRMLLWGIETMQTYGPYIFGGVVILVLFLIFISRFRSVKKINHRIILKIPVVGKLSRNINLAYFSRTLGILIKSGIPIIEAFDITSRTLSNVVYQEQLKKAVSRVERGEQVAAYFKNEPKLFPSILCRMISIGERTGKLDESLLYLADFYEKEIDNTTKNISSTLEPMLLVVIGFVIGFIAISIIMPIYEITHGLSGLR